MITVDGHAIREQVAGVAQSVYKKGVVLSLQTMHTL